MKRKGGLILEQHEKFQQQPAGDMSVGEWLITMLIMIIPIVNIVMLFVWGFGSPDKRRNYARAYLIWMAISIVLAIIFYGVIFAIIYSVNS